MKYQAIFRRYGEAIHVPVAAESREEAREQAQRENPLLAEWPVTVRPLKGDMQAIDDRATLQHGASRQSGPGRPIERAGNYRRVSLEIRADLDEAIRARGLNRRELIERLLEREFASEGEGKDA